MHRYLLIVESPGKIKKISQILGANWLIKASMGHFRTLTNDGEDNLGFDFMGDRISMRFQAKDPKSKKVIKELKEAAGKVEKVYIATDPDREGEVIAWHLWEILKGVNRQIVRVTFAEISENAINKAIAHPRQLDSHLVGAGLARSLLDKLLGFKGSPLVWGLGAKSIGRVQSAVLHLVCDREQEIKNFKPISYFSVFTDYDKGFKAYFNQQEPDDSEASVQESSRIYSEAEAQRIVNLAQNNTHIITKLKRQKLSKAPPPPFITSSLQQAAGSKLGISPDQTMKFAQTLYEKGLITYMRTDSTMLSEEFCEAARGWLQAKDPDNVPKQTTKFRKSKGAQEAHEAIRPSNLNYPSVKLKQEISDTEFQLYLLIWKRAIASQCAPSIINKTTVSIKSADLTWIAQGQVIEYLGYARYWNNLRVDSPLPDLREGQTLKLDKAELERKRTSPPSRYGEPQLVALMEKKGIGRPSTYSSSIKTIKARKYVNISKKMLVPTKLGIKLDSYLAQTALANLIDSTFTANMEQELDAIALGKNSWQPYLCNWNSSYFSPAIAQAKSTMPKTESGKQSKSTLTDFDCPVCKKRLERYDYTRDDEAKSLLRCSEPRTRDDPQHKNVVFFLTRKGDWWSKEFGQLNQNNLKNINNCDRSDRKAPPIRLKTR
jgi:DNA topoisomerase-1